MTPDERALLQSFLRDLNASPAAGKDAEAEAMIFDALRANPDGAYLLVQHAILSDQALHAAQARIAALEAQAQPAPQQASFLPQRGPWSDPQPQAYPQPYPQPPQPQQGGFFGPGPFAGGGGLGSFLRGAGTTAAGVAGGALLFEGLSGLFHGGGGGGGGLFGGGYGGGFGQPVENVTINEYGDDRDDDDNSDDGSYGDNS